MASRDAEQLAAQAEGNMKAKNLTKTGGLLTTFLWDQPLIEYLRPDEQPEFVYARETKGLRISLPDGTERTPHHKWDQGKRYVLVTDQRILYVAGLPEGDDSFEFDYGELVDVDADKDTLVFEDVDGKEYKFVNSKIGTDPERAEPYIEDRIAEARAEGDATVDE